MPTTRTNIIHSGVPSRSALRVAQYRALHQLIDDPLVFEDPLALRILGTRMEAALRNNPSAFNDPLSRGLRAALAARSRFAEEMLARAVEDGVRQYVLLGAGLDTFAYRNPHEDKHLRVYEVDHPSTQDWKKAMLASAQLEIPASVAFAGVDFETDTLAGQLRRAGFRADQPACFAWLGVSFYLSPESVFDTLAYVASLPAKSVIAFDYRVDPALLDPADRRADDYISKLVAERGEPWMSHFDPQALQAELRRTGFSSATNVEPREFNERYFAGRTDRLRVGGAFRMMCATV